MKTGLLPARASTPTAAPAAARSRTVTLAPRSFMQPALHQLFASVQTIEDATLTFDSGGGINAYVSVIDNVTNDPLSLLSTQDTGEATAP